MRAWLLLALAATAAPSSARSATELFAAAGGDVQLSPQRTGHGYLLLDLRVPDAWLGGTLAASFNTDTLSVALDRFPLFDRRFELGTRLRAEALFAGLLSDYFRRGELLAERGFDAHFISADGYLKWLPGDGHSLALAVTGRRWFFRRNDATAEALVLPAEAFVVEPRLHYTFWRMRSGSAEWQPHRAFPRLRGLAAGVEVGFDWRSRRHPWGARDASVFDPVDPRNDPSGIVLIARQWLRAGWQVSERLRWQAAQWAAWGRGEDDLTRVRIGGHNPYVVPLSGQPWAAFLAERFVALQSSLHLLVVGETEVGVAWDGVLLSDLGRAGRDAAFLFTHGVALLVDARLAGWQVDVRGGYGLPATWRAEEPALGLFVAVGRGF